jgi:small GTP-binding protein
MNLPTRLRDTRKLLESLDFRQIEAAVAQEARAQLVIIGPVNSGKSTLFNQLKGQQVSPVSAVPGTTRDLVSEQFGPFWLIDTPGVGEIAGGANTAKALQALDRADVVLLILDASAGVRQADLDLYETARGAGLAVVVVLNKIDLIKRDLKAVIGDAEHQLGVPVIAISAKKGTNVAHDLIPAIIDAHPRMAVTVGRALPRFRKLAARRTIRDSSMMAAVVGAEPIPGVDIPLLIAVQVRMLLRLAMIYGEDMSAARARELMGAIAGGIAIRYGAQELAKIIPGPGWLIAGAVAATGTAALGNATIAFLEQQLSPAQLRNLYKRIRWRRKQTDRQPPEDGADS